MLTGQVWERLVFAARFFARRGDCGEEGTFIVFAGQPLDHAVVVARERRNFRSEECVHILTPTGNHGPRRGLRLVLNALCLHFGLSLRGLSHLKPCTMFQARPKFHRGAQRRGGNPNPGRDEWVATSEEKGSGDTLSKVCGLNRSQTDPVPDGWQCPNLTSSRSCWIKEGKGELCGRERENELDWPASARVASR